MATLYYKKAVSGPTYYTGQGPGSEYLYLNGEKITSKYDTHWDNKGSLYFTYSIAAATFVKPATYDTDMISLDHAEQDHSDYRAWSSTSVPDNFVIPGSVSTTKLPEFFEKEDTGLGFGIGSTTFSYSSNTVAGMSLGNFSAYTNQSLLDIALDAATKLGYGSYAAKVQNSLVVKNALYSVVHGGLDVIDAGFQAVGNSKTWNSQSFDLLVDQYFGKTQQTLNKALIDLKVAPNEQIERYIDGALTGAQTIASLQRTGSTTVSGSVEVGIAFNIADIFTIQTTLTGTIETDIILDGSGSTAIDGKAGDDLVYSGSGNDAAFGRDGRDILYGGVGRDKLLGGNGHDFLDGGNDNDVLKGELENDQLNGGLGNDNLTGGKGRDIFVFDTGPNAKTNRDVITDYNVKDDSLWFENAFFTQLGNSKNGKALKLNKEFFTISDKAQEKDDYLFYNRKTGVLFYDADGSDMGAAVAVAVLKKGLKMTYNDIYFF